MIGKTISHYKILEKLGGGGMGVVYKAEDTKLKRTVALKFLPPDLTRDDDAKERFLLEAQAASKFDHPNICTIHEIDETPDGQTFIAMAYYDGESLKNKIERGALPTDEGIDLAHQIAQGLSKAHSKGIVHRDIKPANIMVTEDGMAKIVDFGLAKLAGQSRLTKTGATLGTVAYMSPEQTTGHEVGPQTDIWSFGVVLYETITGQVPFRGEYEQAIFYSILNEKPEPLEGLAKDVPAEFETVVMNCLEKEPTDRYQSTEELLEDLRQLQEELKPGGLPFKRIVRKRLPKKPMRNLVLPVMVVLGVIAAVAGYFFFGKEAKGIERIPIAVVDFVNETDEKELDGLSGMLITSLEQSRRLSVLTRSRMFDILKQMGKADVELIDEALGREICQQTGVNAMALASVKKLGRVYSVDLKVLDTEKDEYIFTDLARGEGQESVLSMIDNLSQRTREEFGEPAEQIQAASQKVAQVITRNLEAYQHYFQGQQLMSSNMLDKLRAAREEFKQAIAIDSTFGLAYYGLATAEMRLFGEERVRDEYLEKAVSLMDRIPEAERYLVRAFEAAAHEPTLDEGLAAGIPILKEMEKSYPNHKEMLFWLGDWYYHTGQSDLSSKYFEEVFEIDPSNSEVIWHLPLVYRNSQQYEKMLAAAKRQVDVAGFGYNSIAEAYTYLSKVESGLEYLRQARESYPERAPEISQTIADLLAYRGQYDQAEMELKLLAKPEQPLAAQRQGMIGLILLYPELGRYREAMQLCDLGIGMAMSINDSSLVALGYTQKGLLLLHGLKDIESAWKEAQKSFPFKPEIDDLYWSNMARLAVASGRHTFADSVVSALQNRLPLFAPHFRPLILTSKDECDQAESLVISAKLSQRGSHIRIEVGYHLAQCYFEQGEFDKAIALINEVQNIYGSWIRAIYYPKSCYLLGKVYEKKGDKQLAIQSYERLLDLWKDGDQDLPDLIDAKARLARLKG